MAKPKAKQADDLIGKRVIVPECFLITPSMRRRAKWNTLARWNRHIKCKVVKVKTDKAGKLTAIYVVKPAETRFVDGRFVIKRWMKSPKRLTAETFTFPIRRYRWEDEPDFRWKIANREKPQRGEPPYVGMATRSKQWTHYPTIAHWLDNPAILEQVVLRRYDEQRYGTTQFSDNPDSSQFRPKKHWRQWNKEI